MPSPKRRKPAKKAAPKKPARKTVRKAKRHRPGTRVSAGLIRGARRRKRGRKSDLELIVKDWLVEDGIPHLDEHRISRCHVDYFLPESNTIVEVNGCYFHGHGCQKEKTTKMKRANQRDARRYSFFLNAGYSLLILWGCDITKKPDEARAKLREAAQPSRT